MKIKELLSDLNQIAPFFLQEEYDNSGVQFVDLEEKIQKILICLDVTEEIILEALEKRCNVILAHHPLLFHPVTRITRQENPVIYQLLCHKINLIAFHTNFDLAENGLNDYVGQLLGLTRAGSLKAASEKIFKLAVYVPEQYHHLLQEALFQAGAGKIGNYSETSFSFTGKGSFKPLTGSAPFLGNVGQREEVSEIKLETIFYERYLDGIITALHKNHPYEEPAYDVFELTLKPPAGIGFIAKLETAQSLSAFAKNVKNRWKIPYLRVIQANNKKLRTIALCAGSGGSLIKEAFEQKADLFITGDINYHLALQAKEMGLNILDVEHFHSEKFFVPAIKSKLTQLDFPGDLLVPSQKMVSPFRLL